MKRTCKLLPILLLLIISVCSVHAQTKKEDVTHVPISTNQEEYNYLTTGYKFQIENGLDMKKGYKLEEINSITLPPLTCVMKALFRDGDKKPCAFLCIINRPSDKVFICVPSLNAPKNIWDQFYLRISPLADNSQNALIYSFAWLASHYAGK